MANEDVRFVNDARFKDDVLEGGGYCIVGNVDGSRDDVDGALRFTNIQINQGQSVNFAQIRYVYDDVGDTEGDWIFRCRGIDEDNVGSLSSSVWGKSKTSADIDVDEGRPTSGGTKTLDVRSIVNEITDRSGWSSGNAMAFIFEDEGSDKDVYAHADLTDTYLVYRVAAEPNFKPTPKSVSAPSIPTQSEVGVFVSYPGENVLTAQADDLLLDPTKTQAKIAFEGTYTSTSSGVTTLVHDLGYKPIHSVYFLGNDPADDWVKLPLVSTNTGDPTYYFDEDNLYLQASATGQKFYYRIYLDNIV